MAGTSRMRAAGYRALRWMGDAAAIGSSQPGAVGRRIMRRTMYRTFYSMVGRRGGRGGFRL